MQLDNRFFGTWVCSDTFGSEVEVDIQEIEGKYVIDVLDHYDKEGGVVSDIEWDGTLLKFTTKWSSTNHICKRVSTCTIEIGKT